MKFIAQKRAQIGQHDAKTAAEHMSEKDQSKVNTDEIVEQAGSAVEDAALVMNERECLQQGRTLVNGIMTNIAYAPMCVHW
jgi:BioD-like phosphotransacetylase family protein